MSKVSRVFSYTPRELERLGPRVQRWHVRPGMGQTVADHTVGMLLLARRIYPNCTKGFLLAILEHDLSEVVTGDAPAPIKRHVPGYGAAYKEACQAVDHAYGFIEYNLLNNAERKWLRELDLLDALLWSVDCREQGNRHAERTFRELWQALMDLHAERPLYDDVYAELHQAGDRMNALTGAWGTA